MQPKFKKGDWCFCEFKLQQVLETEEGRIRAVSDGNFEMSSFDLSDRCFPITMPIKQASDSCAYWSKEFHNLKSNSLNHPDLNRSLISRWSEMCENIENPEALKRLYESLDKFGRAICDKVRDMRYEEIEGIKLFTR